MANELFAEKRVAAIENSVIIINNTKKVLSFSCAKTIIIDKEINGMVAKIENSLFEINAMLTRKVNGRAHVKTTRSLCVADAT